MENWVAVTTIIANLVVSLGAVSLLITALKYLVNIVSEQTFILIDISSSHKKEWTDEETETLYSVEHFSFYFYNKTASIFYITHCELSFDSTAANKPIHQKTFKQNVLGSTFLTYKKKWNKGIAPKSTSIINGYLLLDENEVLPETATLIIYRAKGKPLKYTFDTKKLCRLTKRR